MTKEPSQARLQGSQPTQFAFHLCEMALNQLARQGAGWLIARRVDDLPDLGKAEVEFLTAQDKAKHGHRVWSVEAVFIGGTRGGTQDTVRFVVANGGGPEPDPPRELANGHQSHRPALLLPPLGRRKFAAADESDELVPFGMA